ncbi:MAG: hypothetical protein ACC656_05670 [Candidatus Heimdallarchaeota archaeon]
MTTLEKIENKRKLEIKLDLLENEIIEEQNKCEHKFNNIPHFDSKFFYASCIQCGYAKKINHKLEISTDELSELQKKWDLIFKS